MTKRDFSHVRRIVIKAGTNILSSKDGINMERVRSIVDQIAKAKEIWRDVPKDYRGYERHKILEIAEDLKW